MKIKLDENIPINVASSFGAIHEVDSVLSEGLQGHDDSAIWAAAQADGRFLITQDLDFSDLRAYLPGTHAGILLLRLRSPSRAAMIARVTEISEMEDFPNWEGCFVVATDSKTRVRRPS
ncbi:MAG: DUF5615 family PIN-like protein [Armatimonadetes bacterium]|nr:DUF5615 family PIN-like protein [Armatimonadota bacterium]